LLSALVNFIVFLIEHQSVESKNRDIIGKVNSIVTTSLESFINIFKVKILGIERQILKPVAEHQSIEISLTGLVGCLVVILQVIVSKGWDYQSVGKVFS
jgi:hypothetical protein